MLSSIQFRWTGLCLLMMSFGALLLFFYGFFPLKYHSGKMGHMEDLPNFIDNKISIDGQEVYNPGENSVILMVIDGLRYDFATEEYMPYIGQLLKNKSACIYVAVAEPPTVTMPRIKAMMTGSVSTFADVVLNFGAPAVQGDSVLRAAASRGKKSVMYGDDTWLRLFPNLWADSDGTTSFYVTDYTEVDNNVTRHLDKILTPDEENKPKFDFLVLHYLGLDHIGHVEGAQSSKIRPKLKEMDDVVKKIFTAMQSWDRTGVLFVCGDHGMRDAGGHGGATPAEVLVPLVVVKSRDFECPHPAGPGPTVAQVDLAPTIAWLLDSPIPGDSTGRILPSLLPQDPRQHLYLLHVLGTHNAKQPGVPTDKEFYKQFLRAQTQFAQYLGTGQQSAAKIAKEFYEESLTEMTKYLSESTTNFDLFAIITAIVTMVYLTNAISCITTYSLQLESDRKAVLPHRRRTLGYFIAFLIIFAIHLAILFTSCFITETKSQLCSFEPQWFLALISVAFVQTMAYYIIKTGMENVQDFTYIKQMNSIDYLLIAGVAICPLTFVGTSFIEEEHMTWYYFWNTLMFFVLIRVIVVLVVYLSKRALGATEVMEKPELVNRMRAGVGFLPQWVMLIGLHRYLRTMNQTGDRWAFLPDTADWLNARENACYLQAHLIVGTLATFAICIWNNRYTNNHMQVHTIFTAGATACILLYRIATQALQSPFDVKSWDQVVIVDVFWSLITAQFVYEIFSYIGVFKICCLTSADKKFTYIRPKDKVEDIDDINQEEPLKFESVKLNFVRSITHLMLNSMMLIIIMLMRPHNVIMVPSIYVTCVLTSKCLDHQLLMTKRDKRTDEVDIISQALVHLWIGMVFFFYQGNSNSLASVDLGAGYVGLRQYCPVRVAARMGLHAYAGPALAGAALFANVSRQASTWHQYLLAVWRVTNVYALQRMYSVLVYCIIAMFFRDHLFVWSVFSPKLLYDFVTTVFTIQALTTIAEIIALAHFTSRTARFFTLKRLL